MYYTMFSYEILNKKILSISHTVIPSPRFWMDITRLEDGVVIDSGNTNPVRLTL